MQLDFWILSGKLLEGRRGEHHVQPVGNADTHGAFCLVGLRLQVTGDRIKRVIQPAQGLRERLSLLGQLDPASGGNEKLGADHVLQPLDLPAYRRLAGVGDLGGAVERLGLGHGEKDPQFTPELSAQEILVVERALVERSLFLVECFHGGFNQAEGPAVCSLAAFSGRSPRLREPPEVVPLTTRSPLVRAAGRRNPPDAPRPGGTLRRPGGARRQL